MRDLAIYLAVISTGGAAHAQGHDVGAHEAVENATERFTVTAGGDSL